MVFYSFLEIIKMENYRIDLVKKIIDLKLDNLSLEILLTKLNIVNT